GGVNSGSAFGGAVHQAATANSTAQPSNAAPATSLALVSTVGPDRGKAQIKIDGQIVATVDLYAPTQATAQLVWSINGLAPGVNHNIQIVATGTKNTAASAAKVDYDAILPVHSQRTLEAGGTGRVAVSPYRGPFPPPGRAGRFTTSWPPCSGHEGNHYFYDFSHGQVGPAHPRHRPDSPPIDGLEPWPPALQPDD